MTILSTEVSSLPTQPESQSDVLKSDKAYCLHSARQYRALKAIMHEAHSVRALIYLAGCNNAPSLVASLKRKGLSIKHESIQGKDRDGNEVSFVGYKLAPESMIRALELLHQYDRKGGQI